MAIVVTLMTPLYAGGTIVLNQRFHPDKFFERISAEKVAVVSVVPTLLQFLLHADLNMAAYKLARLRHFICGAGPLTVELASKFEQTFKIPIIHGYGLSETTCYSCFLPIDLTVAEHKAWIGKFGLADGDVLVVGTRRASRLRRAVGGSVSRYCTQHSSCPVVVVPASSAREPPNPRKPAESPGAGRWAGQVAVSWPQGSSS